MTRDSSGGNGSGEGTERLRSQKTIALLAYLCCHAGRDHGREELADRFWPDADLDAARNSLRVALNSVRRVLEPPPAPAGAVLVATRTHVRLRADALRTDVQEFETALRAGQKQDALAIYAAGPLLPGLYDEWVLGERERLEALADEARQSLEDASPLVSALPTRTPPVAADAPHNLPLTLTRFFGRDEEMARLESLLLNPTVRCITLSGPGGVGKTRLALEAARRMTGSRDKPSVLLARGAWFVSLAELRDPAGLPAALPGLLRDAFGIAPSPTVSPLRQIGEHIGERRTLLLLDNLEQVADGALEALLPLLAALPTVVLLTTSRVRLGLPGERVIALAPLPLPEPEAGRDSLSGSAAVVLFMDRARAVEPDWALTERNAADVGALVTYLEGLPLALELAAAWANVLTPRRMREQIAQLSGDNALDGFSTRRRPRIDERPDRHRSLRAVVAWSYDLLPPDLKLLWARLSVFRGGFTAEAAASVCGDETTPGIHAHLSRLHQSSLIVAQPSPESGEVRFSLLETLSVFAAAQVIVSEASLLAQRHARYFTETAERAAAESGESGTKALRSLAADRDNLRAALAFWESAGETLPEALRLTQTLSGFWWTLGYWREGQETLTRLADRAESENILAARDRCQAWRDAGALAFHQGDLDGAKYLFGRLQKAARAAGETEQEAAASHSLGAVAAAQGDWETAALLLSEALTHYQVQGRIGHVAGILLSLAFVRRGQGDFSRAESLSRDALHCYRDTLHDRGGTGICLGYLADDARQRGDSADALRLGQESIALLREADQPMRLAPALAFLAELFLERQAAGDTKQAALALGECFALLENFGSRRVLLSALSAAARLAWAQGEPGEATVLHTAAQRIAAEDAVLILPSTRARWEQFDAALRAALLADVYQALLAAGKMPTNEAIHRATALVARFAAS